MLFTQIANNYEINANIENIFEIIKNDWIDYKNEKPLESVFNEERVGVKGQQWGEWGVRHLNGRSTKGTQLLQLVVRTGSYTTVEHRGLSSKTALSLPLRSLLSINALKDRKSRT